jgi:hypothetical protein
VGLTARGLEDSSRFATETYSADPQVVAHTIYDWLQVQHKESALAAIEGLAAEMNYSYQLAGTIGESVMQYALQYDPQSRLDASFEQSFISFLQRKCRVSVSESQVPECLDALGWHILAQLSVYRVQPKQYILR